MAETPPKDDNRTPDENNREDPQTQQTTVNGLSNDKVTGPVTVPPTQKPDPNKPAGTEQQADPQLDSKFISNSAAAQLKAHFNLKNLDPHFEEMIREAKLRKNPQNGNMEIQLDEHHQIFAGKIGKQDIIGVSNGGGVDEKAAKAMVGLAKSRGWETVYCTLTSSRQEKENLWLECQRQGVKMGNFEPKPGSDIWQKWQDEQKNGGEGAKLSNVDPDAPLKNTLNLLKETAGASADPQLKEGLGKMYEALRTGNLHVDDNLAKGLAEALSDKHPGREGFNLAAGLLSKAEPPIKIEPLEAAPASTGGQPAPKISQARTAP